MKKLSIAVVAASLLFSGAFVGVSAGGGPGLTEPEVLELEVNFCFGGGPCRFYALTEFSGKQTGQVTLAKNPVWDLDGNVVGHVNEACFTSANQKDGDITNWLCTWVHTFKDTPATDRGTIVTTGLWDSDRPYAVTGGTGAYANVRGYVVPGKKGAYTFHLIP
jgi:hypothetical protein